MDGNLFVPAGIRARYDVKVPMRDGVALSADIYFPDGPGGPYPAILSRTPYDNIAERVVVDAIFFAQHGYVFVAQDVRGRHDSDGVFVPWVHEFEDGHDTIEWIGAQEWCDGNVGMSGGSYVGSVQWQAAVMGSPYLKAIAPKVIGNNLHESPHYQGGAFQLGWAATWVLRTAARSTQTIDLYNWDQMFRTLPIADIPEAAGKDIPYYQDWIDHPDYDEYWRRLAIDERYGDVAVPVLQVGGWYDFFTAGTFNNFVGVREGGGSEAARSNQKAVVGPWVHPVALTTHAGGVDFGNDSVVDLRATELRWFDRWLKGEANGIDDEPPLRIFVMGANEWRDENEWPLARTAYTPFYLHSGGAARSLAGDGGLSTSPPGEEPPDRFAYNPDNPAPTVGGCTCCNSEVVSWGAYDQRPVEYRGDVLVFTSEPLAEDLEVTGPVSVTLYASTDGPDTDFTAKLVDVHPDGYAVNLCDGIVRGRYRRSTARQELLEPGTIYEFTIDLWPTSNVFLAGHRIRVDISSSNFPRFDRNLNTGDVPGRGTEMRTANQTVYHDAGRPSHILLPVIPG